MKKIIRSICLSTASLVVAGSILTGCASTSYQPKSEFVIDKPQTRSITITENQLSSQESFGEDSSTKRLIRDGVNAWNNRSYRQAGDLLLTGYKDGKDQRWQWKTDAKIAILATAMRAYFIAGANEQENETGRFLISELSDREQKYLPVETKVLLYWQTMTSKEPLFENEIPHRLRIANSAGSNN